VKHLLEHIVGCRDEGVPVDLAHRLTQSTKASSRHQDPVVQHAEEERVRELRIGVAPYGSVAHQVGFRKVHVEERTHSGDLGADAMISEQLRQLAS
jgi:hypothetical protein